MTVETACELYLRELEARNLRKSTRDVYSTVFRMLRKLAAESGLEGLHELDKDTMRRWRDEWTCAPSTQAKRLNTLKAFFSFAQEQGWVPESSVKGLRWPKSTARPTMPLSKQEMESLLAAAEHKPRELALLLVLRYAGLVISDSVALQGNNTARWSPRAPPRKERGTGHGRPAGEGARRAGRSRSALAALLLLDRPI